jgi:flavodoxin
MKVLVAYMSQTGSTKKAAEATFQEVQGGKEIRPLSEIDSLEGYDIAFLGFPIHQGGPPEEARGFLEKHANGKNIALFVTRSAPEDFDGLKEWLANCRAAAAGANVIGVFNCQGELGKEVADLMLASGDPGLVAAAQSRALTLGQPDASRLDRARVFARETMAKRATGG